MVSGEDIVRFIRLSDSCRYLDTDSFLVQWKPKDSPDVLLLNVCDKLEKELCLYLWRKSNYFLS